MYKCKNIQNDGKIRKVLIMRELGLFGKCINKVAQFLHKVLEITYLWAFLPILF